jgi:glycosyltransferase involved in cell wall biosynthesis
VKGVWRYCQTLAKLAAIRIFKNPDVYILGFRGYEIFWLVRLITLGKPLVFDHMMSPYDSLLNERAAIRKGGFLARLVYLYERSILRRSAMILTDTAAHKALFQDLFNLPAESILAVPVGADEQLFRTAKPARTRDATAAFEVLFYGSFLPLHGVDIILGAASLLREVPIHFTLIGGYEANLPDIYRLIERLNLHNVTHTGWVDLAGLPQRIDQADVGLGGPFGNTGQARRVVTAKTFQFLAMRKPVIVGETEEDYGFRDKVNCLLVAQGDSPALAAAIQWAYDHPRQMEQIGQRGYDLFRSRYSISQISCILERSLFSEV